MADENEKPEGEDELLLTDQLNPDDDPGDDDSSDDGDDDSNPNVNDEADEEEVFAFGDDIADEKPDDTGLVKHLREELKRARKEAAEARRSAPQEQAIEVGEKPTLAGCDYDEEAYETELDAWKTRKADAERQARERNQASEAQQRAWDEELRSVAAEKAALGRSDADEVFATVREALGDHQNALLIHAVDKGNRARIIYALGKNPERLASLAALSAETNPIAFIKEVTKLEGQFKVVKRRTAPNPDTPQRGSARTSTVTADKQLEKLEKEALRTGDRTKLIAYKKSLS